MSFKLLSLVLAVTLQGGVSTSDGIGVVGIRVDHRLFQRDVVSIVYHGSPAEKAGMKVGDEIYLVNSHEWGEVTGPPGTDVSIVIERGPDEIEFLMERVDSRTIPDSTYKLGRY